MIGQSLINISNGARARLSGVVAAVVLLVFVMFGARLIEQVPMAALTGLMIMVAIGTFEWSSLRTFNKMPKSDIFVMVTVTLVTVLLHNLALAVVLGVVIAAALDFLLMLHILQGVLQPPILVGRRPLGFAL